jgi:hypothetical protein
LLAGSPLFHRSASTAIIAPQLRFLLFKWRRHRSGGEDYGDGQGIDQLREICEREWPQHGLGETMQPNLIGGSRGDRQRGEREATKASVELEGIDRGDRKRGRGDTISIQLEGIDKGGRGEQRHQKGEGSSKIIVVSMWCSV